MKLSALRESLVLVEMAAKKACPVCGHGMANFHFYRNGGWYCKTSSLKAPGPGANTAACAKALSDGVAPRVSGGAVPPTGTTSTAAPKTPKTPKTPKAPAATAPVAPAAPSSNVNYSDLQKKIDKWLLEQEVENYTINEDNTVSIDGDLELIGLRYNKLPVTFKEVTGDIRITGGSLSTLDGLPKEINGHLSIAGADNITLRGAPRKVGGLDIHGTILTTFSSSPIQEINGDVTLSHMKLTNLQGLPSEIAGSLTINCSYNGWIRSLDGCPKTIGKHFKLNCSTSTSIDAKSLPTHVGGSLLVEGAMTFNSPDFSAFGVGGGLAINVPCTGVMKLPDVINGGFKYRASTQNATINALPSEINGSLDIPAYMLAGFPKIHQTLKRVAGSILLTNVIEYAYNSATSKMETKGDLNIGPVLGLTMIKGVTKIELMPQKAPPAQQIQSILDRVVAGDIDVYEAQDLLIDAGFSKQARL